MESRFTKEQLLEFYLNSVFFGNNAYGVKAAAEVYFGKDLADLTIAEAAALPVPIRNPTLYDLRRGDEIAVRARDAVIDQMVEEGYITAAEGAVAKASLLTVAPPNETARTGPPGADRRQGRRPQRSRSSGWAPPTCSASERCSDAPPTTPSVRAAAVSRSS